MRQSIAVAANSKGDIISAVKFPLGLSLSTMPRDQFRSRFFTLLSKILKECNMPFSQIHNTTICIGLTGATFPCEATVILKREINDIMEIKPGRLICACDAEIIFASHAVSETGSAIISSMGSSVYVRTKNEEYRLGGWGPAIGDEGSGFWMGKSTLRAIGAQYDLHVRDSHLWTETLNWLSSIDKPIPEWRRASLIWNRIAQDYKPGNLELRTAVSAFAQELCVEGHWFWRTAASSLVIPLMRAWKKGDPQAKSIMDAACDSLCNQFMEICKTAQVELNHGPLVLYGGVLTHHLDFRNKLITRLVDMGLNEDLIITSDDHTAMRPVIGALFFALGNSDFPPFKYPPKWIVDKITLHQMKPQFRNILKND